jgi:hypothetical protein
MSAIGIENRLLTEPRGLPAPHLLPCLVEGFLELLNVGRGEAPQKVSGRGGIGNTLGRQAPRVALIVAQPVNILQASASGDDVVSDVEHMVGFEIGDVHLQQRKILIDGLIQA